jgi:RNA polymerase sigma-70 factor, ECF subfamily
MRVRSPLPTRILSFIRQAMPVAAPMAQLFVILFQVFSDNRVMTALEAVQAEEEMESGAMKIDFEALLASEQKRIFLLCMRLLRDRDEADTATQDVFVEAYRAIEKRGTAAILEPAKWLTRVALNTCYERIRSKRWRFWQRHSSNAEGDAVLRVLPAAGPNQENAVAAGDIRRRLESALQRLSLRQRAVFILRHDEDRSIEEIAGIMELDTGTVKAHMARAIKKLREELRDLYVR